MTRDKRQCIKSLCIDVWHVYVWHFARGHVIKVWPNDRNKNTGKALSHVALIYLIVDNRA